MSEPSQLARETADEIHREISSGGDRSTSAIIQSALDRQRVEVVEEAISKVDELAKKLVGNTMYESATRKVRDIDLYYEGIGCEKAIIILRQLSHPTDNKQDERSGR